MESVVMVVMSGNSSGLCAWMVGLCYDGFKVELMIILSGCTGRISVRVRVAGVSGDGGDVRECVHGMVGCVMTKFKVERVIILSGCTGRISVRGAC